MPIDLNTLKWVADRLESTNCGPAAHEAWELLDELLQLAESEQEAAAEASSGYYEHARGLFEAGFKAGLAHYLKRPA